MATKIRLRRMGARNKPFYRLVVADSRFATTGRYLEVLGWYDPKKVKDNFSVKLDRVDYWQGVGAQMSFTAKSLIKKARAGEGVEPGTTPEKKTVDTQALLDAVSEPVEKPVEEPVVDVSAEASAKAETAAEEAPAADVSGKAEETKPEEAAEPAAEKAAAEKAPAAEGAKSEETSASAEATADKPAEDVSGEADKAQSEAPEKPESSS